MYKLMIILLCFSGTGCVSKYTVPEGVSLANVKYISHFSVRAGLLTLSTGVWSYENSNCTSKSIVGSVKGSQKKPGEIEIKAEAGKLLYNTYVVPVRDLNTVGGLRYKYHATRFMPEYGKEYEIEIFRNRMARVHEVSNGVKKPVYNDVPKNEICRP